MKNFIKLLFVIPFIVLTSCKQSADAPTDSILTGSMDIVVDETILPIIDDQVQVFQGTYDAKIYVIAKSETEVLKALIDKKANVAVLTRKLAADETKVFASRKIFPKTTIFAADAVALIANNKMDTIVAMQDILDFINGNKSGKIKGLVFDNPNSSTVRLLSEKAGVDKLPESGIFSVSSNADVIKYVADNSGIIGVVGLNWLSQPDSQTASYRKAFNILSIKTTGSNDAFYPSQINVSSGNYPLARQLFIVNCQGYTGLGMGFASFVAGDVGQRIILASGLVPVRMPAREIVIRKKINNDKNQ